ncbi:MurR/RpiR family transcriptional regulator [Rhodobacteraceae bacterium B1Z28]|uniref:MurR/RpiR family transcriptional regulator n=1 Tax=Ruegeria haliotis TaxID=2747601 RepID=A0ABX2PMT6_9RHOB|nr:MurR/RpiR family transcriptional regulator [Ruegeria haliotis]NVO55055.1 MurR/RpiR family transcriptional regulator [Ruegeria haliotis]
MIETPSQIIDRLRRDIDGMPAQLQAAAKYVIDHPGDFGINPIRVTAESIGISSNVLVRLAQRLGFDGFEAFRRPFRQALVTDGEDRLSRDWLTRLRGGDEFSAAQADYAQNELNVVTRSLRLMNPEKLRQATEIILASRRCFVTATRASYGLAYYFHYAGRMAHPGLHLIPRHMGSAIDDLLDADEGDCLLAMTVRPYSSDTIRSMRFARDKGARIILISDSDVIAPGIQADVTFQISTRSMHHFSSFSGAMAVLECLLGHLFAAGAEDARRRVEEYQKAREDTGAYWQPSKSPRLRRK